MKKGIAIIPGSFDPITNGHLYIIKKASEQYEKVYVAVMINETKTYMFTLDERKRIAEAAIGKIENVEIIASDGWLWKLAKELGATAIVKGYRNDVDIEYENKMAEFNSLHYPEAKTVLVKAEDTLLSLSSTLVREYIKSGKNIESFIPKDAIDVICKIMNK